MTAERLKLLDVLRACAAIMVVVFHTTQTASHISVSNGNVGYGGIFWPFEVGAHGVSAFFMISGFVICMSLMRVRTLRQFAVARFFRLYPIFWVAVIFTVLWRVNFGGDQIDISVILANITMIPGFFGQQYVDGVYWTLAIELQFYLLMAIVWRVGLLERVEIICVFWLCLSVLVKLLQRRWPEVEALEWLWRGFLLPYAPFFSLGMLACSISQARSGWGVHMTFIFALVLVFASGNLHRAAVTGVVALILLLIAYGWTNTLRIPVFLIFLGEASYSIYLFHQALGHHALVKLDEVLHPDPVFAAVLTVAMCLLVGVSMHMMVEKPLARWTARWKHRANLPVS